MEFVEKLSAICKSVKTDEPMSKHTTFKIGGNADYYCSVSSAFEIKEIINLAKQENLNYLVIGNGSNLLVSDDGIRGIVIEIGENMQDITTDGETVTAMAGAKMVRVSNVCERESLTGFECLSGIPGTVGGGVYMNCGAYGSEIKDVIETVTAITEKGEIKIYKKDELELGYRTSIFTKNNEIILSATFKLNKGNKEEIQTKVKEITAKRVEKQPLQYPSAGSTFKRPEGYFAGKLIEDSSLKGKQIGGAKVSEKHAGFVINTGNATCKDVLDLIELIQKTVYENFGVNIYPEVKIIR